MTQVTIDRIDKLLEYLAAGPPPDIVRVMLVALCQGVEDGERERVLAEIDRTSRILAGRCAVTELGQLRHRIESGHQQLDLSEAP